MVIERGRGGVGVIMVGKGDWREEVQGPFVQR